MPKIGQTWLVHGRENNTFQLWEALMQMVAGRRHRLLKWRYPRPANTANELMVDRMIKETAWWPMDDFLKENCQALDKAPKQGADRPRERETPDSVGVPSQPPSIGLDNTAIILVE